LLKKVLMKVIDPDHLNMFLKCSYNRGYCLNIQIMWTGSMRRRDPCGRKLWMRWMNTSTTLWNGMSHYCVTALNLGLIKGFIPVSLKLGSLALVTFTV